MGKNFAGENLCGEKNLFWGRTFFKRFSPEKVFSPSRPGRTGPNDAGEELPQPDSRAGDGEERRQWTRKYVSAEGKMRIICALDKKRLSSWKKIMVNNISAGGIQAQTNFLSIDDLHIVGDLDRGAWMPNILEIELELPSGRPVNISFQGKVEYYLKTGAGPYYMVGISIRTISKEDGEKLLTLLEQKGS